MLLLALLLFVLLCFMWVAVTFQGLRLNDTDYSLWKFLQKWARGMDGPVVKSTRQD